MPLLELLVSPPGTGKTSACIELFKKWTLKSKSGIDSRSFFVLPSREHAERIQNLILKKDTAGLFNAHVVTINDLTAKFLGISAATTPTDQARRSLIRGVFETEEPFKYFGEAAQFPGFYHLLSDAIKEFKSGLLTPQEFVALARPLLKDPVFRLKAHDFLTLFKKVEARLKSLGLKEAEDSIAELLKKQGGQRADLVIFDGFYHFTRAQRELIKFVARSSRHAVVTLTMPEGRDERDTLFFYPRMTRDSLTEIGFKEKRGFLKKNTRTLDEALLHLEAAIFSKESRAFPASQDAVSIFEAPGLGGEMEMIVREIRKLHREKPLHYSDICVLLRDVGTYEKVLDSVFADFGIPVYIHERKKLIEQGFIRTLYRFFNLIAEDWQKDDLFFVVRSSFLAGNFTGDDAAELQGTATTENILKGREKWFAVISDPRAPEGAKRVLRFLFDWEDRFRTAASVPAFRETLFSFISRFRTGENEAACLQALESILQGARKFYEGSRAQRFAAPSFAREFLETLEASLLSFKPEGKNRVQVYDVVMALPKEYKVVFVAGLLEKGFPQAVTEDPLFKDSERRILNRKGVVLEERLWRAAGERYFFYMGITRAKDKLYLSYPLYNSEGKPSLPSFFVDEVRRCFNEGAIPVFRKRLDEFLPAPPEWETEEEVTRGLSEILFTDSPFYSEVPAVLNEWMEKPFFREIVRTGGLSEAAQISDPRIKAIFGGLRGPFSATRLETYATCAFKYFSEKTLRLAKPLEGRESLEMGTILHQVLEEFYKGLPEKAKADPAFWGNEEKTKKALHAKLEEVTKDAPFRGEPLYRQRVYRARMREMLDLFAVQEKEFFQNRRLVPSYFEHAFGDLKIPEPSGGDILIEGKIDRIDTVKGEKKALIVDYKLSERPLSIKKKLAKGLEFQIPLYLLAVKRLLGLDVIGGELRFLKKAQTEGLYREAAREVLDLDPRTKTLNDEAFERTLSDTEDLVRRMVGRLRSADISVKSKSCDYCPFSSVCRFEPWKLVYAENN